LDSEAKRVSVISPVVNIYHVPILWLPWLSLPLSNRQTGLLIPKPGFVGVNGFSLEQPVFITLGRSADLTLTPGFFTGVPEPLGVRGVRVTSELRYVLSRRAEGRVVLGALYDLKPQRDPFTAKPPTDDAPPRGLRGELSWWHQQDFDGGWGARLNLNAHSDAFYYRDITPDVLASAAGYLRSTALLFQRGPEHLVSADVTLRQDLRFGYDWLGRTPVRNRTESGGFSTPEFGPGTLQRFPALTASLPMTRLVGPLWLDVSAEAVRLAPLFSITGDEGGLAQEGSTFAADGSELSVGCQARRLYGPVASMCSQSYDKAADHQGDRDWQLGEREARDRLTIVPRLHASGSVGQVVSLSASAWWRQSVWWGEASSRSWQRGALVVDARAETELSRSFSGGWRHAITPLVAFRAIPWILRSGASANATVPSSIEPVPYDEVDAAIPAGGTARAQGVVELRQRLKRGTSNDGLQLNLGQGVELLRAGGPALSESWATLDATAGLARLRAVARLAPGYTLTSENKETVVPLRLTRLGVSAVVDDGRGHGLTAGYDTLLDEGSAYTRAPIDLLFGDPVPPTIQSRTHVISAGAWWNFGPVSLRYSVILAPYTWVVNGKLDAAPVMSLSQHSLSVSLSPACDCWRFDLLATQTLTTNPNTQLKVPDFGASVSVSGFGSIGTR
jgi:LPS-assembly protein